MKLQEILVATTMLFATSVGAQVASERPTKPADLTVYITGDPADAAVTPQGPALLLMGGGSEVTKAFANRAFPLLPGGDIVVLRASGADGYNNYFFSQVTTGPNRPNSVETMVVDTAAKANSDYVEWVLATAEMIWMAGGNQSNYTSSWRGTKVEEQLRAAYERGAVIGGTSAGMAVAANFIYDPGSQSSLTSANALSDPFHPRMVLTERLFDSPWMDGVVTDTHFRERDRMARTLAMMANIRATGRSDFARAIAASEGAGIFIDKNGMGYVDTNNGRDAVYVIDEHPTTERVQVVPGQPFVYTNVRRYRLVDGQTFNFATGTASVPAMILSVDGRNTTTPFSPPDPYGDPEALPVPDGEILYEEKFEDAPEELSDRGHDPIGPWRIAPGPEGRGGVAQLPQSEASPWDNWLITPATPLDPAIDYFAAFWYRGTGTGSGVTLDVYLSTTRTPSGMTNSTRLQRLTGINSFNTPDVIYLPFTVDLAGAYALGFHAQGPAGSGSLEIDDILLIGVIPRADAVELLYPVDGSGTVYTRAWLVADITDTADSYTFRLATTQDALDENESIIASQSEVPYADPGRLLNGVTYFARVDTNNFFGATRGPVTEFTVLPAPRAAGDLILTESFDGPWVRPGSPVAHPELPLGWEVVDLDGAVHAEGFASSWFIDVTTRARSNPQGLVSRYNLNQTPNNDWIFLPAVTTSSARETLLEFHGRVRQQNFPETVSVYTAIGRPQSIDPGDYTLLDTFTSSSTTHQRRVYTLPAGGEVRVAIRYHSNYQSQFIIDDVRIIAGEAIGFQDGWMLTGN